MSPANFNKKQMDLKNSSGYFHLKHVICWLEVSAFTIVIFGKC